MFYNILNPTGKIQDKFAVDIGGSKTDVQIGVLDSSTLEDCVENLVNVDTAHRLTNSIRLMNIALFFESERDYINCSPKNVVEAILPCIWKLGLHTQNQPYVGACLENVINNDDCNLDKLFYCFWKKDSNYINANLNVEVSINDDFDSGEKRFKTENLKQKTDSNFFILYNFYEQIIVRNATSSVLEKINSRTNNRIDPNYFVAAVNPDWVHGHGLNSDHDVIVKNTLIPAKLQMTSMKHFFGKSRQRGSKLDTLAEYMNSMYAPRNNEYIVTLNRHDTWTPCNFEPQDRILSLAGSLSVLGTRSEVSNGYDTLIVHAKSDGNSNNDISRMLMDFADKSNVVINVIKKEVADQIIQSAKTTIKETV